MGKNAGHKAMQAQRYASSGAGGDGEAPAGQAPPPSSSSHQEADVTYHTPEWHAARIAALTSTRMSWDDFRKQQRDLQAKEDALVGSEKALREHRALLDAERAARLGARAGAGAGAKEASPKKKRKSKSKERSKSKDKKSRKKSSKDKKKSKKSSKKKRRRSSSSDSGSSSSSSSGGSSDSDSSGSDGEGERRRGSKAAKAADGGPIKLSEYLRS